MRSILLSDTLIGLNKRTEEKKPKEEEPKKEIAAIPEILKLPTGWPQPKVSPLFAVIHPSMTITTYDSSGYQGYCSSVPVLGSSIDKSSTDQNIEFTDGLVQQLFNDNVIYVNYP